MECWLCRHVMLIVPPHVYIFLVRHVRNKFVTLLLHVGFMGFPFLVTSATGFIGSHCSLALKKHDDEVLGLDNFNDYYNPLLKRVRSNLLSKHQVFIVEGDLNGVTLLTKLFDIVPLIHMLHLVA
ncbi:hypothetical protein GOBAR_DD19937 [Gossypium barbadense]|nr:hypothetical protein GOBAR_DD19937 [Gossypium barbadense]